MKLYVKASDAASKTKFEIAKALEAINNKYDCLLGVNMTSSYQDDDIRNGGIIYLFPQVKSILGYDVKDDYIDCNGRKLYIKYIGPSSPSWDCSKSYKHNLAALEDSVSAFVNEQKARIDKCNSLDEIKSDLEKSVPTVLNIFVEKYKNRFPRLDIDEIEVYIVGDSVWKEYEVMIRFELCFEYGDITVTIPYEEWKSSDIDKKLLNKLIYHKRKYGRQ